MKNVGSGLGVALCGVVLLSCMSSAQWNADQTEKVRKRASFDLSCPSEKLNVVELGRDSSDLVTTLGVEGCEKKATYVYVSEGSGWAMDSGEGKQAVAPAQ
jgi:hypothetical protein